MKKFVYNSEAIFNEIENRLRSGDRIVVYECDFPEGCEPRKGKVYFYLQEHGVVVGVCDLNNSKNVSYAGINRDLKFLFGHQAIEYDNLKQIRNLFYRIDAVYSSTNTHVVYYIDGYGYEQDGKYVFRIKKNAEKDWRAYILQMPDLEGRNPSLNDTHRLYDSEGYYVCIQGKVESREKMIGAAKFWATRLHRYIKTGQAMQ